MGYLSLVFWLIRLPCALDASDPVGPVDAQPGDAAKSEPAVATTQPSPAAPAPAPVRAAPPAPVAVAAAALPWLPRETASYRVTYGIMGQVAEATLSFTQDAGTAAAARAAVPPLIRAVGAGNGAVLGFGKTDKRIESEFDARTLASRRWINRRLSDGKTTFDTGEQPKSGSVSLLRKRTGEPDLAETFSRTAPVLDPLSFLLRLRMALPEAPTTYEILDGRALWLAEISAARPDPDNPGLLRLDGKVDPIYWSGGPDKERSSRSFALYVTRDRFHTPVRLVVPFGMGEVRAEMVRLERPDTEWVKALVGRLLCGVCPGHRVCRGTSRPWPRAPISP
jgi:hypothetical protein